MRSRVAAALTLSARGSERDSQRLSPGARWRIMNASDSVSWPQVVVAPTC